MTLKVTENPNEWLWAEQVEDVLLCMDRRNLANEDYFLQSVDQIEELIDPHTGKRLTLSALNAWLDAVHTPPKDEESNVATENRTRIIAPSHRDFH